MRDLRQRSHRIMRALMITLLFAAIRAQAQRNYAETLDLKVEQIKLLDSFDQGVAISESGMCEFMTWNREINFYIDDIVCHDFAKYVALSNSLNVRPGHDTSVWRVVQRRHPYIFLRDTATSADLEKLLESEHPMVRTYAFASLARRNYPEFGKVILKNLADTSRFATYVTDVVFEVSPADLMLWYTVEKMDLTEKENIRSLIITKYRHLYTLDYILMHHPPDPLRYQSIREIALAGKNFPYALVALARYQRAEDIELIRSGFTAIKRRWSINFFTAIENFPHASFKNDLIAFANAPEMKHTSFSHYILALASYQDPDCLKVIEKIVDAQISRKNIYRIRGILLEIDKALKKYSTPINAKLIDKIARNLPPADDLDREGYTVPSPWDFEYKK